MLSFSATTLHSEWSFQKTNLTLSPSEKKLSVILQCSQKRDWNPSWGLRLSVRLVCSSVVAPHCPLGPSWCSISISLFFEQLISSPSPGSLHVLFELTECPLPSSPLSCLPSPLQHSLQLTVHPSQLGSNVLTFRKPTLIPQNYQYPFLSPIFFSVLFLYWPFCNWYLFLLPIGFVPWEHWLYVYIHLSRTLRCIDTFMINTPCVLGEWLNV